MVMILLYILLKHFFKGYFFKRTELSDGKVISLTKKEYFADIYFLQIFIKSLKSISDE